MPRIRTLLRLGVAVLLASALPASAASAAFATTSAGTPASAGEAAAAWSPVYRLSGNQTGLPAVVDTGPGDVWAAGTTTGPDGYARPAAYHTVAGTTATTLLELDWTAQWGRFLGIDGVGDDDLWAAGVLLGKASGTSTSLLAHWDGIRWLRVPFAGGAQGESVAVAARSTDDVWFAGTLDGLRPASLLHWDGTAVRTVPVRIADPMCTPSRATVTALTVTAADVWLGLRCGLSTDAREEGSVQVLHAGRWLPSAVLPPSSTVLSLALDGTGTVWATGNRQTAAGYLPVALAGRARLREVATFGTDQILWAVAARGNSVYLVGQQATSITPLVPALAGSGFVPEPVAGDQPLFGVTVDPAGTAWAVGPAFGGSFGPPSAGLWRRTG